ncbi:MAG: DUF3883 domain-containing protein [Planctomycetia bacterium]|nr:DUF3883 domain-containing protein [Planctomycetia bacterium]
MAHYIHYWVPLRAELAFNGQNGAVLTLESGWFKTLRPNDVVWIVTRDGGRVHLVLRFEVRRIASVKTHPAYAVGNSSRFEMTRAFTDRAIAVPPCKAPVSMKLLRQLRFDTSKKSDRIVESGLRVFELELAAMRRLKDDTHRALEELWTANPRPLWNGPDDGCSVAVGGAFATPEIRLRVEKAAIRYVTAWHGDRGWSVLSRERDGVGFDLECMKQDKRRCVEVKGTSAEERTFVMTRGEYGQARDNPEFILAIVSNALVKPDVKFVTGEKLLSTYIFEPLSFTVGRRG